MPDVTVVGAGPVGLWTAAELARRGVEVVVIERLARPSPHSKALTIHPRTLEVFAQRGLVDRFLATGIEIPDGHFANLVTRLDFRVLDTPFPYTLLYSQEDTEIALERQARELGVVFRRGQSVVDVRDTGDRVSARVADGESAYTVESCYLVGADGARSLVRDRAGIAFVGTESTGWGSLADVTLDAPPPGRVFSRYGPEGGLNLVPLPGGDLHRIVVGTGARALDGLAELTFDAFRAAVIAIAGTDFGMRDPVWLSRFGNSAKVAVNYRSGRVLLAGDAAHIHSPAASA